MGGGTIDFTNALHATGTKKTGSDYDVVSEWVQLYGNRLTHVAMTYLKDYQLAQDCVQDVFLTALERHHSIKSYASIKSWLYTCTVNRCRSMLRSKALHKLVFMDHRGIEHHAGSSDMVYSHLDESGILAVVMNLPMKYREVIYLRYYHDLAIEEISTVLGTSSETIRTRLKRARDRLKKVIEEAEGNE